MPAIHEPLKLENLGSLITIAGTDHCLGDLMHFPGHGVFCPNNGLVDVTPEQADAHNKALDTARMEGLDRACEVGMCGMAYLNYGPVQYGRRPPLVRTFIGTLISADVTVRGNTITFRRHGKTFRGRTRKDSDLFQFRRIA